jgi:hypothetical protein
VKEVTILGNILLVMVIALVITLPVYLFMRHFDSGLNLGNWFGDVYWNKRNDNEDERRRR